MICYMYSARKKSTALAVEKNVLSSKEKFIKSVISTSLLHGLETTALNEIDTQ